MECRENVVAALIAAARNYGKARRRYDEAQAADQGHQADSRELDDALREWTALREAATPSELDLVNRILD